MMGAGRSEAQVRRTSMSSSSRSSSGYQSEATDELDGISWTSPRANPVVNGSCTDSSEQHLEEVRKTARLLASDIIDYMRNTSSRPCCRHAVAMRHIVDELSSRHQIIFSSIARKIGSFVGTGEEADTDRWQHTFVNVSNGLFADGQYNWGRIVTTYAFAGWLARQCGDRVVAKKIADTCGDYVAERLADWICRHGGWEAFEAFFPVQSSFESTLWRGLLFTLIALGVLALMTLTR